MQVKVPTKLEQGVYRTQTQDLLVEQGQLILAVGGSKSGKSKFLELCAQEAAQAWQLPLCYLATLEVGEDPENQARVARHRAQRAGKGFITLEAACQLRSQLGAEPWLGRKPVLLLECLGTLLANEIFSPSNHRRRRTWALPEDLSQPPSLDFAAQIARDILVDLVWLQDRVSLLLLASNDVFSNCPPPDPWSALWVEVLGLLHQELANQASAHVLEVSAGIPLVWRTAVSKSDRGKASPGQGSSHLAASQFP